MSLLRLIQALRVRRSQGRQAIPDLRAAVPRGYAGRPRVVLGACESGCRACVDVCPTHAIDLDPVRLDLGRCVFCRECELACPAEKIAFTSSPQMASSTRQGLMVWNGEAMPPEVAVAEAIRATFGRSLKLRSVSAGGCNACELELGASANVNFDLGRYGIEWVASPRHADALVLSGPLTKNMADALELAWAAVPEPRFVVAFGACAISGGLYASSEALDRRFLDQLAPALYVPGCPPHPLTFAVALLDLLGVGVEAPPSAPPPDALPISPGAPAAIARRDTAERLVRALGVDLGKGDPPPAQPARPKRHLRVVPPE